MKKHILLAFIMFSAGLYAQKPIFVNAKTKSATVYFNSAEISQTTNALLPKGTSEIVVKNVADYLNENTVRVGVPASVTVLSVQFSNNYMSEFEIDEKNPAIKKVRDSINLVTAAIAKTENARDSEAKAIELLDKNQQIAGTNSTINVMELMKLVDYYKLKRTDLGNTYDVLEEKVTKLNEILVKLNQKLEINTQKEEKSSNGKLIIQVMNEVAGTVDFDINYITNNASWQPFYDLRANNVVDPIQMVYKAKVFQSTGIDWKKVKLTLSSGNPNQNNEQPILGAWWLRYQQPIVNYKRQELYQSASPMAVRSLAGKVSGLTISSDSSSVNGVNKITLRGARTISEKQNALVVINNQISTNEVLQQLNPDSIKSMNVLKGAQGTALYGSQGADGVIVVTTKQMSDYTNIEENQLNISFDIDIPYDILSNGKAHCVALKEIKLPATYKYYAAPRVEKEAFLLAEIKDYAKYNLLQGEANIIFEDMYIGKTMINPNQTADTLSLSMGRDKKIAIKREKVVEKSGTKFLSSKKEQTFTYDITVRNSKKETIDLMLKDQYPLSPDKEIEVEMIDNGNANENKETGILTWNISLKPQEIKKIRISYKVRYPKDRTIENL